MSLFEKWRPTDWSQVIGQDAAVATVQRLRDGVGLGGQAFWVSGKSGTGKTTIARLIGAEIADDFNTEEQDAQAMTPKRIREIEKSSQTRGLSLGGKSGRAIIINEAHGLTNTTVRQLLTTLERIPGHVVWIMTTTTEGGNFLFEGCDDAGPLLSRCIDLPLAQRGLAPLFAAHVKQIAESEGLGGKELKAYERLTTDCKANMRQMLQAVVAGRMMADTAAKAA